MALPLVVVVVVVVVVKTQLKLRVTTWTVEKQSRPQGYGLEKVLGGSVKKIAIFVGPFAAQAPDL